MLSICTFRNDQLSQVGRVSELRKLLDLQGIAEGDTQGDDFPELVGMKHASANLLELLGNCPAAKRVREMEKVAVEKAERQKKGCQELVLKMMSFLGPRSTFQGVSHYDRQLHSRLVSSGSLWSLRRYSCLLVE